MIAKGKTQLHLPTRQQLGSQGMAVLHAAAVRNKRNSWCYTEMQAGFGCGMGIFTPQRGYHQREGSKTATTKSWC